MVRDALYYFLSDVHLGSTFDESDSREKFFTDFLKSISPNAKEIYLLGDIFDFWVEYKDVIPKGYIRIFAELARLSDSGVRIYYFRGNHDYWLDDYFQKELGINVIDSTYIVKEIAGKRFCLGHGDGLGPQSFVNRLIFKLFRNKFCIRVLKLLHPHCIFDFAHLWSKNSRRKHLNNPYKFRAVDDSVYKFANDVAKREKIDYFIFGHIHDTVKIDVENGGTLYITDDWDRGANYLYIDGKGDLFQVLPEPFRNIN